MQSQAMNAWTWIAIMEFLALGLETIVGIAIVILTHRYQYTRRWQLFAISTAATLLLLNAWVFVLTNEWINNGLGGVYLVLWIIAPFLILAQMGGILHFLPKAFTKTQALS